VLAGIPGAIADEDELPTSAIAVIPVRMAVAIIPVVRLFLPIGLGEFVRLLVILREVESPGLVLAIVPVVVVLVITVVDPNLHAGLLGRGGCYCHWGGECCSKE
jgi:hypothetical protein